MPNPDAVAVQMMSQPKPPDPMLASGGAERRCEKVRAVTVRRSRSASKDLDHARLAAETQYKHLALQAKSQLDIQKMELDGLQGRHRRACANCRTLASPVERKAIRMTAMSMLTRICAKLKKLPDQQNQSDSSGHAASTIDERRGPN